LNNELGNDVHLVWALSKDFGSSGFRIGVLYTQNELIISALNNINMFCSVSHPMQAIVKELLSDDVYIDNFLDMSRLLLKKSYDIVTSGLEKMGIPFIKAQAGIFIYVDFSSLLRVNSFDGEDELAKLFENYARIVMTPGSSQSDNKPGRFRICYAFVSVEVLEVAMLRLACVVKMLKEYGWENIKKHIDETTFLTF
jgi:aspartate/methionine/tyrosine aminotransferase